MNCDDRRLKQRLRNFFGDFFSAISGDSYLAVRIALDNCDISSPEGKGVHFSSEVTQEERDKYFAIHPDRLCFWTTPAGHLLKEMMSQYKPDGNTRSAIPSFSFDDFKKLKIYLAGKFAEQARGNFYVIVTAPHRNDQELKNVLATLAENQRITMINGQSKDRALHSLNRRLQTDSPMDQGTERRVVCLHARAKNKIQLAQS